MPEGVGINNLTEVEEELVLNAPETLRRWMSQHVKNFEFDKMVSLTVEHGVSWPVYVWGSFVYKCAIYYEHENMVYDWMRLNELKDSDLVVPFEIVRYCTTVRGVSVCVLVLIMEKGLREPTPLEYAAFMRAAPSALANHKMVVFTDWRIENTTVAPSGRVCLIDLLGTTHRVLRTREGHKHGTIPDVMLAYHSTHLKEGFLDRRGTISDSMVVAIESVCVALGNGACAEAVRAFKTKDKEMANAGVGAVERAISAYNSVICLI